jgi:hypothetical protein
VRRIQEPRHEVRRSNLPSHGHRRCAVQVAAEIHVATLSPYTRPMIPHRQFACPDCGALNVRLRHRRWYDYAFTWGRFMLDSLGRNGNAPQAIANHRSECRRPWNHSRL